MRERFDSPIERFEAPCWELRAVFEESLVASFERELFESGFPNDRLYCEESPELRLKLREELLLLGPSLDGLR